MIEFTNSLRMKQNRVQWIVDVLHHFISIECGAEQLILMQ